MYKQTCTVSYHKKALTVEWQCNCCGSASFDADPDQACHSDADPVPAWHFDADPNPTFAGAGSSFQLKSKKPWKSFQIGSHSTHFGFSSPNWCGSGSGSCLWLWCGSGCGSYLSIWCESMRIRIHNTCQCNRKKHSFNASSCTSQYITYSKINGNEFAKYTYVKMSRCVLPIKLMYLKGTVTQDVLQQIGISTYCICKNFKRA